MIVPDVNLLVYAYNQASPLHPRAAAWWEDLLSSDQPVGISWAVAFGFLRLVTHPSVLDEPIRPLAALDRIDSWLERPNVRILEPGPHHLAIVRRLFAATGVGGNLTTDTHLAALALEHRGELHTNDADFARFPDLRWQNPLN